MDKKIFFPILVVGVVALFFQSGAEANTELSCKVDSMMEEFEKSMMSCMLHSVDASLMIEIIENIKHLDRLLNLDFICRYPADMAKLTDCMAHKYITCLPTEAQAIIDPLLPSENCWKKIVKVACDNRKVLGDQCMTEEAANKFMTCYQSKLMDISGLMESFASTKDLNPVLRHILQSYEHCISANSGSCSSKYINLIDEILSMLIDNPNCEKKNPFDAVLVQGHPLKFKPMGRGN